VSPRFAKFIKESIPGHKIAGYLEQALSYHNVAEAFNSERLRLALELWSDYHREGSLKARFLTLVMALEVLAPPAPKHEVAQAVIDRWDNELHSELQHYAAGSEEREAIESLRREVLFRREQSIRSRIRKHILYVVGGVSPRDADATAKMAVHAYDLRGRLLHTGTLAPAQLSDGHHAAHRALRTVLLASFGVSAASPPGRTSAPGLREPGILARGAFPRRRSHISYTFSTSSP